MKLSKVFRGAAVILSFLMATVIGLTVSMFDNAGYVNRFLNIDTTRLEQTDASEELPVYYKSDYGKDTNKLTAEEHDKLNKAVEAFVELEQEEGSVLLKNEKGALPLTADEIKKVSLFGRSTVIPYRKANSGGGEGGTNIDYLTALDERGFKVNQTLINAYKADTSPIRDAGSCTVGESPSTVYTDAVLNSFAGADVAIVMLSRDGGENHDLSKSQLDDDKSKVISQLALHKNEKDMLQIVKRYKDNGTFKKVIALLNTSNAMEVGWLDEYGVDACLWIGGPGNSCGFRGVADLLTGSANPSGRLADTYATNSLSAPATTNMGSFEYTNSAEIAKRFTDEYGTSNHYVVLQEGIYVGYRYYETRYEDCVLGQGNAESDVGVWASDGNWSYASEVSYPFGYGLSYTNFTQTLDGVVDNGDGTLTATVTVKNTGSVKGKSVVEIYAQTPYGKYEKDNLIEKSSIALVAFDKTDELDPGEPQTLTLTVDKYFLASYDSKGAGTYILSEGKYYLALGDNAHDALNNVLAAKKADGVSVDNSKMVGGTGDVKKVFGWNEEFDDKTYAQTKYGKVENRLDNADINYWQENTVTYLSRKDWKNTYPTEAVKIAASDKLIEVINVYPYKKASGAPGYADVSVGEDNGIKFADMWGVDKESDLWDKFVRQFSLSDLAQMTIDQNGLDPIGDSDFIAFPGANNTDGIDGVGVGANTNSYVNQSVAACSWSVEMLAKRGYFMGEDSLFTQKHHVWAPGGNMHRTPFGGRNFEYHSEDPFLAYQLLAAQVEQMQSKGLSASIKHFVTNDQETHRNGLATYGVEQAFREISFRAFEGAFVKGGANATMTSFNRIGPVWIGHCDNVQNDILRGEWGFYGIVITDAAGANKYMHSVEAIVNGTSIFCYTDKGRKSELTKFIRDNDDGAFVMMLQDNAKEILYSYAHTNRMNGLTRNTKIVNITPWWEIALIVLNVLLGIVTLGAIVCFVLFTYVFKKKENKESVA